MKLPREEKTIYEKEQWWLPDEQIKEIARLNERIEILENNIFYLISIIGSLAVENNFKEVKVSEFPEETKRTCPVCKAPMVLRSGKYGKFWGCSNYPICKKTIKIFDTNGNSSVRKVLTNLKRNIYDNKKSVEENSIKLPWDQEDLNNGTNDVE
jgi:ribosomal protein L37AE/L43A